MKLNKKNVRRHSENVIFFQKLCSTMTSYCVKILYYKKNFLKSCTDTLIERTTLYIISYRREETCGRLVK